MDVREVRRLRDLVAGSPWLERAAELARSLVTGRHEPGGLLLVGTPDEEPWHLVAHLDDEARWSGRSALAPTWVRWSPPPGAPAHLAVGLQRLERVRRGETVFVATPSSAVAPLLERVSDARRRGALILAVEGSGSELQDLAHDGLVVPQQAPVSYDLMTHLVSTAAGEADRTSPAGRLPGRLARLLSTATRQT